MRRELAAAELVTAWRGLEPPPRPGPTLPVVEICGSDNGANRMLSLRNGTRSFERWR